MKRLITELDGKKGVIDGEGNEIIPLEYDRIDKEFKTNFSYRVAKYQNLEKKEHLKWGLIDVKGNIIKPLIYDNSYDLFDWPNYNHEIINVIINEEHCLINRQNEIIFRKNDKYDSIGFLPSSDMIKVKKDKKVGYLNLQLEEIIPPIYKAISKFSDEGLAIVIFKDILGGLINNKGEVVLVFPAPYYPSIRSFNDGFYHLIDTSNNKRKRGLFDLEGKKIIDCKYEKLSFYVEQNLIRCFGKNHDTGKSDFIICDYSGKIIRQLNFDEIKRGEKNRWLIGVEKENGLNYGILDHNGQIILAPQYLEIKYLKSYDDDLVLNHKVILAMKNDKYGIITEENSIIIPFNYPKLSYLNNGVFKVSSFFGGGSVLINSKNEILLKTKDFYIYQEVNANPFLYSARSNNSKWGIYNLTEKRWQISPIYDNNKLMVHTFKFKFK